MIYQETASGRREVAGRYVLRGRDVGFEVPSYDARKALVIDPVFLYSTFLGGNDNDLANGIAVDGSGNAYITGTTLSTNLPTMALIRERTTETWMFLWLS